MLIVVVCLDPLHTGGGVESVDLASLHRAENAITQAVVLSVEVCKQLFDLLALGVSICETGRLDHGKIGFAGKIAREICKARQEKRIETTLELSNIIKGAIPAAARADGPHPAKRTFQAIRIEVNAELDVISPMITAAAEKMANGGRIAIISFHSLEDRIVKQAYKELATGCTCPRDFPVCVCGKKPILKELTKKPILPSEKELEENPRSRSAKLRIAEKL